jgi:hypothetical protein
MPGNPVVNQTGRDPVRSRQSTTVAASAPGSIPLSLGPFLALLLLLSLLLPALARLLEHLLALGAGAVLPFAAKFGAALLGQALVFPEVRSNALLFVWRQILEFAPATADQVTALFG